MACEFPYMVKPPEKYKVERPVVPVPCGKCYDCKMRNVSQWAFRLRQHEKVSDSAIFLTLTYDTEHVPISQNGFMTLNLIDVQKFIKRLRKRNTHDSPISYFAVGEYGSKRKRPHYHIILFNSDPQYVAPSWTLGSIHMGAVTGASVAYTLKYMLKEPLKKYGRDDRTPEFRIMSKRLGANYLTNEMLHYHRRNPDKLYSTIEDGIKVPLARYYRNKIWTESEITLQGITIRKQLEKLKKLEEEKDENITDKKRQGAEIRNKRAYRNAQKRDID